MSSVVFSALASGALGLIYSIANTPEKILEKVQTSENEALITDCKDCIRYMENAPVDTGSILTAGEKLAVEKCQLIREQPVEKLESIIRTMLKSDTVDKAKLSKLAASCRDTMENVGLGPAENATPPTSKEATVSNEEYANHYTHFSTEWTDMSSFDEDSSGSESSVASGIEMMTNDDLL